MVAQEIGRLGTLEFSQQQIRLAHQNNAKSIPVGREEIGTLPKAQRDGHALRL